MSGPSLAENQPLCICCGGGRALAWCLTPLLYFSGSGHGGLCTSVRHWDPEKDHGLLLAFSIFPPTMSKRSVVSLSRSLFTQVPALMQLSQDCGKTSRLWPCPYPVPRIFLARSVVGWLVYFQMKNPSSFWEVCFLTRITAVFILISASISRWLQSSFFVVRLRLESLAHTAKTQKLGLLCRCTRACKENKYSACLLCWNVLSF